MRITLDFAAVLAQWPLLAKGVLITLLLTAVSAIVGVVVGIACAWARSSGPIALRVIAGTYVELVRNTPFIVMLGSAVCGQISVEELSYAANLIQSRNFRAFEAFIIATGIYLVLAIAVRRLLDWAGPRFLFHR